MTTLFHKKFTRKTRRIWIIITSLLCLSGALILTLEAFSSNIIFFMTPSQIKKHPPMSDHLIRLGGMVVAGSHHHHRNHNIISEEFDVTDGQDAITVIYHNILPDLFREGQSVVALGTLTKEGRFKAEEVLAKHDETYMPKEVAEALQKSGKWDPRFGPPPDAASWNRMTIQKSAQNTPKNAD